jgi:hypothetical protein
MQHPYQGVPQQCNLRPDHNTNSIITIHTVKGKSSLRIFPVFSLKVFADAASGEL